MVKTNDKRRPPRILNNPPIFKGTEIMHISIHKVADDRNCFMRTCCLIFWMTMVNSFKIVLHSSSWSFPTLTIKSFKKPPSLKQSSNYLSLIPGTTWKNKVATVCSSVCLPLYLFASLHLSFDSIQDTSWVHGVKFSSSFLEQQRRTTSWSSRISSALPNGRRHHY